MLSPVAIKNGVCPHSCCSSALVQPALLFEKSWNECKTPSFLHKAVCIESDHDLMKMQCCLSIFMALNFGRLW